MGPTRRCRTGHRKSPWTTLAGQPRSPSRLRCRSIRARDVGAAPRCEHTDRMPWQLTCPMEHGFSEADREVVEQLVDNAANVLRMGWQLMNPPTLVVLADTAEAVDAIAAALAELPFARESLVRSYERSATTNKDDEGADVSAGRPDFARSTWTRIGAVFVHAAGAD